MSFLSRFCFKGFVNFGLEEEYEPGTCLKVHQGGVWNSSVTRYVYTREGLLVELSERAQKKLQRKYKGTPMIVKYHDPTCCGCVCCACFCCQCKLTKEYMAYTKAIQFATSDDDHCCGDASSCFCDFLSCGLFSTCNYWCCTQVESIEWDEISPARIPDHAMSDLALEALSASKGFNSTGAQAGPAAFGSGFVQEMGNAAGAKAAEYVIEGFGDS